MNRHPLAALSALSALVALAATLATPAVPSYAGLSHAGFSHTVAPRAVERGVKHVPVPREARAVDTSHPDHVVGDGTKASCTSRKVVRAVRLGGVVTFACGPDPVVIRMRDTAKVRNDNAHGRVVLDGGGLVTLSGMGKRRILYQNTCDKRQVWTTSHCDDQARPRLVVQHLTFADGNSTGRPVRGRWWRGDLRARWSAEDRRRPLRRQPL